MVIKFFREDSLKTSFQTSNFIPFQRKTLKFYHHVVKP